MKTKPIGCICKDNHKKCVICVRIDLPRYSLVKVNLSPSRIVEGEKHLAPIILPRPKEVPPEVKGLLRSRNNRTNNSTSNPTAPTKSPFTCIYGGEDTTNRVMCPSCGGSKTQLKVFECLLPEIKTCTVGIKVPGIQCCKDCNKFQAK